MRNYYTADAPHTHPTLIVPLSLRQVYGSSITFYERYPDSQLTPQQRLQLGIDTHHPSEISVNTNRSIGVLSHWPFFDTFDKFLQFLHQTAISGRPTSVPLERWVTSGRD